MENKEIKRGVAILTFNRCNNLQKVIESILDTCPSNTKVVVCDDGSDDDTYYVVSKMQQILYVRGPNKGVTYNKNRALFTLQDCSYLALIEDDLVATKTGWFERYEEAVKLTNIQHFCRVQDKEIPESIPNFTAFLKSKNLTPIYGPSPRGDFTFITNKVLRIVGGLNPAFLGVGYSHGEWSNRIANAELIQHPLKWIDIKESRDSFEQVGDQEGGRWNVPQSRLKEELKRNRAIQRKLKASRYVFCPLSIG